MNNGALFGDMYPYYIQCGSKATAFIQMAKSITFRSTVLAIS